MMVFMYETVLSIPMFQNRSHNTHFYMTVIFQQKRRANYVMQSLIIYHMHPSVYWSKKIEKSNIHWRICLGIFWKHIHYEVCIQSYFTLFSITYNWYLFIIILRFYSSFWKIETGNKLIQQLTGKLVWIWHYFIIMQQTLG